MKRKGFILYVVLTVLLGLGILAFALSSFKSGSVFQLTKTSDQNKLIQLAQSANAEAVAYIRTRANTSTELHKRFTDIFNKFSSQPNGDLPSAYSWKDGSNKNFLAGFEPKITRAMAESVEFKTDIQTVAELKYYRESDYISIHSYIGYIDIISTVKNISHHNSVSVKERREIRAVDLRHFLDKYVLYVKAYSPDINNPSRKIIVQGIGNHSFQGSIGPHISRVYLGNLLYPEAKDACPYVWLDICADDVVNLPGFSKLFPNYNNSSALNIAGKTIQFLDKGSIRNFDNEVNTDLFYGVREIKDIYEDLVTAAAIGLTSSSGKPNKKYRGSKLLQLCEQNMDIAHIKNSDVNSGNSSAYAICEDYKKNARKSHKSNSDLDWDYSRCQHFMKILNDFLDNWRQDLYKFVYADSSTIWNLNKPRQGDKNYYYCFEGGRSFIPRYEAQDWNSSSTRGEPVKYRGLTYASVENNTDNYIMGGSYMQSFACDKDSSGFTFDKFNFERARIGKMAQLYGAGWDTPVLIEGPVFLRFYKLAYLHNFNSYLSVGHGGEAQRINPNHVTLRCIHLNSKDFIGGKSFLNSKVRDLSTNKEYYSDNYLMSHAIDNIPVNSLLGNRVSYYDKDSAETGEIKSFDPMHEIRSGVMIPETASFPVAFDNYPLDNKEKVASKNFVRYFDLHSSSYNYKSPESFLKDRVKEVDNGSGSKVKVLFIDGIMYISNDEEKALLDLTGKYGAEYFSGSGIIYLEGGDCKIGNLKKFNAKGGNPIKCRDTLRLYVRNGHIIVSEKLKNVEIHASLYSLKGSGSDYPRNLSECCGIRFTGQNSVHICGNLIVDYLYTAGSNNKNGLMPGGKLIVEHDYNIYDPRCLSEGSPYRVSIGPVKTSYSINSSGKE